ncbi:hypothetical protein LSCM1_04775 [Leishmania martiniquensis]|uniref:UBL3-like ubiquitin domain-containing protein n=1 Tax=Leishmania martiniquensis TaxID=1580590 RepID=A0A836KL11_9TRYP|nr:hypothetical protein LSCM1_04775 [Leishmania martiniquensis]
MVAMQRVRVRCVLTGACTPIYSGRVVHATVPLLQADGSAMTIEGMKSHLCSNWPSEMSEMADVIKGSQICVLKAGRALNDSDFLEKCLTTAEQEMCVVSAAETSEERKAALEKPSVLLHLVIQKNRTWPVDNSKKEKSKSGGATEGGNSGEGHEVKKDSCCCVM